MELFTCTKIEGINQDNKILDSLIRQTISMAKDSENAVIEYSVAKKGVLYALKNPNLAFYVIVKDNKENKYIGCNILSQEYDLTEDKSNWLIGTLNVDEEYRRQGIFSSYILKFDESIVKSDLQKYKQIIRLYMDNNNERAEKAYFKNGFTINKTKVVYEDDILASNTTNNSVKKYLSFSNISDKKYSFRVASISDLNAITSFIKKNENNYDSSLINFCQSDNINIKTHFSGMKKVLETEYLGNLIILEDQSKNDIRGIFYASLEPSDWRACMMWWIYGMIIEKDFVSEFINTLSTELKFKLDNENKQRAFILSLILNDLSNVYKDYTQGLCIRFYLEKKIVDDKEASEILSDYSKPFLSHYLLFEKPLH